jgi:prepilin-type N-terminal cleavage/methylation domain-containing protein
MKHVKKGGFTLIELLIVVAIIAILAAIAVPNFLEAQVRAKVARVKSDIRSLATALEAYAVDNNAYVPATNNAETGSRIEPTQNYRQGGAFHLLSTPVAYFTNPYIEDPFFPTKTVYGQTWHRYYRYNGFGDYGVARLQSGSSSVPWLSRYSSDVTATPSRFPTVRLWALTSFGPDRLEEGGPHNPVPWFWVATGNSSGTRPDEIIFYVYDATNGTASGGDIFRIGGSASSKVASQAEAMSISFGILTKVAN